MLDDADAPRAHDVDAMTRARYRHYTDHAAKCASVSDGIRCLRFSPISLMAKKRAAHFTISLWLISRRTEEASAGRRLDGRADARTIRC